MDMNELHDRINRVINTMAFEAVLSQNGSDLIEFQCTWHQSGGKFDKLPQSYQDAIISGEKELEGTGEMMLA